MPKFLRVWLSVKGTGFYVGSWQYSDLTWGEPKLYIIKIKTGNGPAGLRHQGTNSEQEEKPEAVKQGRCCHLAYSKYCDVDQH